MNNKGFAISAVLYTLLIAFLLFLGVTLAVFKSSARTIGNSNNDIIDGKDVRVSLVKNMNDYSGDKFVDCTGIGENECDNRKSNVINNYTNCIKKSNSVPSTAQHFWYEYTECKLNGEGKFSKPGEEWDYGFTHWELIDISNPSKGMWGCHPVDNQTLVKIDSIKGPIFWPRDFKNTTDGGLYTTNDRKNVNVKDINEKYKGISVTCSTDGSSYDINKCTNSDIYKNSSTDVEPYYIKVELPGYTTEYIGGVDIDGIDGNDAIKLFDFCE